jgi:hypothetical protein
LLDYRWRYRREIRPGGHEMDSEGYRRLNAALTALAEQSNDHDVQLRWLALAQESSSLAMDPPQNPKALITEETENARVALLLNSLANA